MFFGFLMALWATLLLLPRLFAALLFRFASSRRLPNGGLTDVLPCLYDMVVELCLVIKRGLLKPSTVKFNYPLEYMPVYGEFSFDKPILLLHVLPLHSAS